jgi:hypothetical protein
MQTPVGLLQASAYLGLGYRWHHNDLRGITTLGSVGYRRTNQRVYAPLGLQVSTQAPKVITASFEYTPTLHGLHTTHMTDIGATQDATVTQKSQGWALQVGWQFSPGWEFGLYHRQWNTQATAAWNSTRNGITQRYFEPASQWRDAGLKLSHQF